MGTQKKNPLDKIDIAIKLVALVMALCSAGVVTMVIIWLQKPLRP